MEERDLELVQEHARAGALAREKFFSRYASALTSISKAMARSIQAQGKVLFCGNGGSAADAQHLAAEFVNRFLMERPPLPAIALTTDTSVITAVSNDYSFDQVFVKQVMALGRPGDILVGISTSGGSANVNLALSRAKSQDMITIGLSGKSGGEMQEHCDHLLTVEDSSTPVIQEIHIAAGHVICRLVDYYLFQAASPNELGT